MMIHRKLKEEGNRVKVFKIQNGKRRMNFYSNMKKEEKIANQLSFNKFAQEADSLLKEMTDMVMNIRETVSQSLKDYNETLRSFSDIRNNLGNLIKETGDNFNDCSPIMSKKMDLFLNFGRNMEYTEPQQKEVFLSRKRTSVLNPETELFEQSVLKNSTCEEMHKSHRRHSSVIYDNYEARRQLLSNYFKMTPSKAKKTNLDSCFKTPGNESN